MGVNGNGARLRVCVQQRQRLFRRGLVALLQGEPDIEVAGAAVGAADLIDLAAARQPHVLVLDLSDDGAEACRLAAAVRVHVPRARFVGLAASPDVWLDAAAASTFPHRVRGADGVAALLDAVRAAARAEPVEVVLPSEDAPDSLSPREIDVLGLVGAGCTTREISERLAISRKTVENHKQHIFSKLQVRNQAHAVAVAMRTGMITVDGVLDLRDA
jgi:DNA-binding NarL/FixJ family response regulator